MRVGWRRARSESHVPWLLRLYPASFRNEYGREMAAVFARERRDTRTAPGMAALWLRAIADTCLNAAGIHWDIFTQHLRYTLRTLRRTPAFALTACWSFMPGDRPERRRRSCAFPNGASDLCVSLVPRPRPPSAR